MKRAIIAVFCVLYAGMVFAADRINIVASIIPLYNIVKAVAGDRAVISFMVPPGTSPHTFSPKPSQLISLAKADIFIRVGAGLDFWADKMIEASGNKKVTVLAMTDGIKLIAGDADEQAGNPHVWLDPINAIEFSGKIYKALAAKDPKNSAYYLDNLNKFTGEIRKLDIDMAAGAAKFRIKEVVSFHPAWVYFERRYGLKEAAVIETTPGREPSPRELIAIVDKIKKYGIKTIFAETTLPRKAADVIAREAGVNVLVLNPEGGDGESYTEFMMNNFNIMKEAMQ